MVCIYALHSRCSKLLKTTCTLLLIMIMSSCWHVKIVKNCLLGTFATVIGEKGIEFNRFCPLLVGLPISLSNLNSQYTCIYRHVHTDYRLFILLHYLIVCV